MTVLSPDGLRRELESGNFRPVYLVLGPDEYRSREMVRFIKSVALDPATASFNFEESSAANTPAGDALQSARTLPMLAPRRVVILNDVGEAEEEEREAILDYVQRPETRNVVVLASDEIDRRTTFYKKLREEACTVEFPVLKGDSLESWTAEYIRSRGARVSRSAIKKLVDLIGGDLRMLTMEIEKLLLTVGEAGAITEEVVAELVGSSREQMSWSITDAMARGDRASAIRILNTVVDSDDAALAVLGWMAKYYRQILFTKDAISRGVPSVRAAQAAGVYPSFAEKFAKEVRAVDGLSAIRAYRKLARIDLKMKSSSVNKKALLEDFVCSA
jgi:DNA polymerase III subunit delta